MHKVLYSTAHSSCVLHWRCNFLHSQDHLIKTKSTMNRHGNPSLPADVASLLSTSLVRLLTSSLPTVPSIYTLVHSSNHSVLSKCCVPLFIPVFKTLPCSLILSLYTKHCLLDCIELLDQSFFHL